MNFFALQVTHPDVNFALILPELIVCARRRGRDAGRCVCATRRNAGSPAAFRCSDLLPAAVSDVWLWVVVDRQPPGFQRHDCARRVASGFHVRLSGRLGLTILISTVWVENEKLPAGEFHSLLMFATAGMMLMASGGDLVIVFLGLEILSIATYVMAGFRRTDVRSNESSLKYFILGSFSSAFLLYGIALIYGATVDSSRLCPARRTSPRSPRASIDAQYPPLLFAGAAMMLVGFGFKIATAPFHIWTPDVYEGAPTPVTAFMAAGPKAAGFASFMRVFVFGFPFVVAAVSQTSQATLHTAWVGALVVLAILTMTVGNVVAIVQNNVKRMLAYSSIAHAGYALVGFVAAGARH